MKKGTNNAKKVAQSPVRSGRKTGKSQDGTSTRRSGTTVSTRGKRKANSTYRHTSSGSTTYKTVVSNKPAKGTVYPYPGILEPSKRENILTWVLAAVIIAAVAYFLWRATS